MNKAGKAQEITIGGCLILILFGAIFLSASSSDTTGILNTIGIIFIGVGIIGLIALLVKFLK